MYGSKRKISRPYIPKTIDLSEELNGILTTREDSEQEAHKKVNSNSPIQKHTSLPEGILTL